MKNTKLIKLLLVIMVTSSLAACGVKSNGGTVGENKTIVNSELTIAPYDKYQLVNDATVIMEGKVVSKEVKDDFEGFPATDFTIKVTKIYRGEPDKEIVVRTKGGENDKMIYNPESEEAVAFEIGEKVVVFLTDEKGNRPDKDDFGYFVLGQYQGKFIEENGKYKNKKYDFDISDFEKELKEIEVINKEKGLKKLNEGENPNI